ncbi:uncharacterized protein LOC107415205 [Ziziphus jujuba]|uniref:Uncharacterized protein LOC107415205 n=2 Tax=Ziziphus jujuba TaxID=326968 RepID=A0A6P3ZKC9_ZIZJJ|nr:uncharacterized protein LOC107415205 [Ziziphus jujuba]KAH7544655.1 hypothetical protein FEM48_Zijuj01G0008900 [Ziziphus jujuba var. spinosa]
MTELDHKNINEFDDAEDADEALSLSELPLNEDNELSSEEAQEIITCRPQNRRSSSETPEFFEFFSDVSSDSIMCSAEDIIYCGKLVPFNQQQQQQQHSLLINSSTVKVEDKKHITAFRRRSESLSQIESSSVTRSDSTKTKLMMRNSRSLDYRKLHRPSMVSPDHPEMERNSSVKSVGKSDFSIKKVIKPRWCFLMFGIAKVPAEMDLSDIKSRQFRRNHPSTLFPPVENPSVSRSSSGGGKASWKLLKALSCKDHASVAVTASLCAPQA